MRACVCTLSFLVVAGCGGRVDSPTEEAIDTGVVDVVEEPPADSAPLCCVGYCMPEIEPANAIAFVDLGATPPKPATLSYRAYTRCDDGTRFDSTRGATFSVEDPVGTFEGATFTSFAPLPFAYPHGILTSIHGTLDGKIGFSGLILVQLDRSRDLFFVLGQCAGMSPERGVFASIASASTPELSIRLTNEPNPDGVDATSFIETVRAVTEGDAAKGCAANPAKDTNGDGVADTFTSLTPGTAVCFEVVGKKSPKGPRLHKLVAAFADAVGPSGVSIDRHVLVFLLPFKTGVVC